MLSKGYKIVSPHTFEIYIEDLIGSENDVIVRIDKAAICKADLRYYIGDREVRMLGLKYPMSLLHEAIGTIISDKSNKNLQRQKVVLIPNQIPNKNVCDEEVCSDVCKNRALGYNYCPKAKFASSNSDGFCKQYVKIERDNVIAIPQNIPQNIAAFTEVISVLVAAIRRVRNFETDLVAVWGDGILGYILCCILKNIYHKKVVVIGKHVERMKQFCCDEYYSLEAPLDDLKKCVVGFECVGGIGMEKAINQMLQVLGIGSEIILTGVSEGSVPIKTRRILEKGITLTGSTRSQKSDFEETLVFLQNELFQKNMSNLVLGERDIRNISDLYNVFEEQKSTLELGKYILNFRF